MRRLVCNDGVFQHRQHRDDAAGTPLFGQQRHALLNGVLRTGYFGGLAVDFYRAGRDGPQPEDRFHQLGALCAHQPAKAQYLALVQRKADILKRVGVGAGEVLYL
ncbi:hypothetical protein SDC9_157401 [bioreactor metagenome]|uniref:Uncharacterized protein n=1 Tax=bioreactor metagenome TaxID=1076179 RepID=A0A645F6V3_9ZZZZ